MEAQVKASRTFEDLKVWQKAHTFVLSVYAVTKMFPSNEAFGITSQIRRSAVSVPANIAEGYKRLTKPDKLRFFNIAQASLEETRYYVILCRDLKYIDETIFTDWQNAIIDISQLLGRYCSAINKSKN
ncbi:MAG TPA: four helix bundle protein [Tenuifilaceae bacterium]|nr:four helix bundle protein [Tenuifilaceae bacterium]HQB77346.1 four helix bundle protein [Tenuifilaceae bacterium]